MNANELLLPKKLDIPKFSRTELLGLQKYDAMLTAIAACQEVDEIKDIHDKAKALQHYAAEAKNYESELRAMDIRIRASRRAWELLGEMDKRGDIARKGRPKKCRQ